MGKSLSAEGDDPESNLLHAVSDGDFSRVTGLLAAKADVNAKAKNGSTALKMATQLGQYEAMEILKKA